MLTEQEERENQAMAEAMWEIEKIASVDDKDDPAVMQAMLAKIYQISARFF